MSIITILFGMIFLSILGLNKKLIHAKIGIFFTILGFILILMGLWKYEYYKYDKNKVLKYNFLGLLVRKYSLNEMTSYKNKFVHMGYNRNPFAIITYFRKNTKKFIEHNTLQVSFSNGAKLKIDERTMTAQDFISLKKIIKNKKNNISLFKN